MEVERKSAAEPETLLGSDPVARHRGVVGALGASSAESGAENRPRVIVVGGSTRSLASSVYQAGWEPLASDLFDDLDLRSFGKTIPVSRSQYPGGLGQVFTTFPDTPWLYTGGLENEPELLTQWSQYGPLWGNDAAVVTVAKDPFALASLFARHGFSTAGITLSDELLPRDGSWIWKPARGTGGSGLRLWGPLDVVPAANGYWQQFIEGASYAAAYLATEEQVILLGVSRQLLAKDAAALIDPSYRVLSPFSYCGSIGPLPMPSTWQEELKRLGDVLHREIRVRGLFGVDFVVDGQQTLWPIEINPRPTASMELWERFAGLPLFALHRSCFDLSAPAPEVPAVTPQMGGKVILFADKPGVIMDHDLIGQESASPRYQVADIPCPGLFFESGDPLVTAFASGEDESAICRELARNLGPIKRSIEQGSGRTSRRERIQAESLS